MTAIRLVLFSLVFIATSGVAVLGSSLSFRLYKNLTTRINLLLIYQQLLTYAFLFYGIWGNIFIIEIIDDLQLLESVQNKILLVQPILGLPFLVVGWYMLIQLFFELNNIKLSKAVTIIYILICVLTLPAVIIVAGHSGLNHMQSGVELVNKFTTLLNFVINLSALYAFTRFRSINLENEPKKYNGFILLYFVGVLVYSIGVWNVYSSHFILGLFTILAVFVTNLFIPLYITRNQKTIEKTKFAQTPDFESFCAKFEISRREAEIIQEICSGKSNREISEKLFITLQTVKDHIHRIFTKTGVSNRVQLSNLTGKPIK